MTPFGVPVEPEVYCKKRGSAGDTLGASQEALAGGRESLANQVVCGPAVLVFRDACHFFASSAEVSTTRGFASLRMSCSLGSVRSLVGGKVGTAMTPA